MQSHTSLPKLLPMIAAWLVAFPTITALLVLLAPVIADWPLLARTFVLTLVMVPVISIATPAVLQLVRRVFQPPTRQSGAQHGLSAPGGLQALLETLDQIHPFVQHSDDHNSFALLDKKQVVMLAVKRAHSVQTGNGSCIRRTRRDPHTAVVQRLLISVGLFFAPGRVGVEPDVDKVVPRRASETVVRHLRLCAARGRRPSR